MNCYAHALGQSVPGTPTFTKAPAISREICDQSGGKPYYNFSQCCFGQGTGRYVCQELIPGAEIPPGITSFPGIPGGPFGPTSPYGPATPYGPAGYGPTKEAGLTTGTLIALGLGAAAMIFLLMRK